MIRSSAARSPAFLALFAAASVLSLASIACVSEQTLAQDVANAARPSTLPLVVACWEKEFEASEFRAEYVATVSFVIESGTSKISDAKVTALDPSRDTPPSDTKAFSACVEDALNRSALPTQATSDGPGFAHGWDVALRSYRIAFIDASPNKRKVASEKQAHVLLGPRSDRCQGLYSHDPPRDASTLYSEVAAVEGMAARHKPNDQDLYAREIQKAFDARVELRDRLALDMADPLIPEANKKRLKKALDDIEAAIKKTGSSIGCSLPPRASP